MDLEKMLRAEHSKNQKDKIVRWVGDNQERFDALFNFFTGDDYRLTQVAGYPLSYCAEAYPDLIKKHFAALLKNLSKPGSHPAIKRNTVRILENVPIPSRFQGQVMNTCFEFICDPLEKPAVKASSLTVLENLLGQFPEISNELKVVIETQWQHETPAFRARARKILRKL